MFGGNQIPREEFTGKFAEGIELTDEWLDLNSYETDLSINSQPSDVVASVGDTVTFSVEAENVSAYRWYYSTDNGLSWGKIPSTWDGATEDTLTVELTSARMTYLYRCQLTDASGNIFYTHSAQATDADAVSITSQPVDALGTVGDTITFSVTAENAVSYRWYYSADEGGTWTGALTDTLSVELTDSRIGYWYRCKLTDQNGNVVDTDYASVTNTRGITITGQPETAIGSIGDTITFHVEAENVESYRWYYSPDDGTTWNRIPSTWTGVLSDTLEMELNETRAAYLYRCGLTDVYGNESYTESADVFVNGTAVISVQPESAVGSAGDTVTFSVTAEDVESYRWYYSSDDGTTWNRIPSTWTGVLSDTLTVELNSTRVTYLYRCELTSTNGIIIYSDSAEVISE